MVSNIYWSDKNITFIVERAMKELECIQQLDEHIGTHGNLINCAFQNLDLTGCEETLASLRIEDSLFLGCTMSPGLKLALIEKNMVFPRLNKPYNPYMNRLYIRDDLYCGFNPAVPASYHNTLDAVVYRHYIDSGADNPHSILDSLAQRLHDYSITDALMDIISTHEEKKTAAIMGGHGLLRTDANYLKAARISKKLCEKGYLMLSGGGPGAMEATHLGAWFAGSGEDDLRRSIDILAAAPSYRDERWLSAAFGVMQRFPEKMNGIKDIGIPTWHYGHEPATPFAGRIAKFFANSVREEGLLALAKGGIVYTPGSAGTIQEIFQDAAQNHYRSYGFASPMVFLGREYWTVEKPVYGILKQLAKGYEYESLISISDDVDEIVECLLGFK